MRALKSLALTCSIIPQDELALMSTLLLRQVRCACSVLPCEVYIYIIHMCIHVIVIVLFLEMN